MRNRYLFTVYFTRSGNTSDEAWKNAINGTNLEEFDSPEKDDWEIIGEEDEDE